MMYILELNHWERYEYNETKAIAVSNDVDKLKLLASENPHVYDEQWGTRTDFTPFLEFDHDYSENDPTDCYAKSTYIIRIIEYR